MKYRGFTLAELLIALAILGVIATFTIPKVLNSQRNQEANAVAKEFAGMISEAYQAHKANGGIANQTAAKDLTPYFNYVTTQTRYIDNYASSTLSIPCGTGTWFCYELHNGGVFTASNNEFALNTTNTAIFFYFDPDGEFQGTEEGSGILFWMYLNGRIVTYETLEPNTCNGSTCAGVYNPQPNTDPEWFSW